MRLHAPMTMGEVADLLGYTGRYRTQRARRFLLRVERSGKQVMRATRGPKGRVRYVVTMASLKKHVPELFSYRDAAVEAAREQVEIVEDRLLLQINRERRQRQAADERLEARIDKVCRVVPQTAVTPS